jgi:hypothetical protein
MTTTPPPPPPPPGDGTPPPPPEEPREEGEGTDLGGTTDSGYAGGGTGEPADPTFGSPGDSGYSSTEPTSEPEPEPGSDPLAAPPPPPGYGDSAPPPPAYGDSAPPPPPPPGGAEPAPYGAAPSSPMGAPAGAPNNQKAVIALVTGIASIVFAICCSIVGVVLGGVAIFLGQQAKKEVAASGGTQGGANFAQYGFITGIIGVGLAIVMIILSVALNIGGGLTNFGG